ncbi:unnamed protein product [Arabidopsis halleri]
MEVAGNRNRTDFFRRPVLLGYRFKPSASRQFYWAASVLNNIRPNMGPLKAHIKTNDVTSYT